MPVNCTATWTLELNTECPHCEEYVDLLDTPEFWEVHGVQACESETDKSTDVEVECPKCGEAFVVDFVY